MQHQRVDRHSRTPRLYGVQRYEKYVNPRNFPPTQFFQHLLEEYIVVFRSFAKE